MREAIGEAEYASELGYEPARDLLDHLWKSLPPEQAQQQARIGRRPPRPVAGEIVLDATASEIMDHFERGVAHKRQEQWKDAANELKAALQINPDFLSAHVELGKVYARQRRWNTAIQEFRAALRINPDYANAHFYLGLVHAEHSRWGEAAREFQETLSIDPNHAEARRGLDVANRQLRRSAG